MRRAATSKYRLFAYGGAVLVCALAAALPGCGEASSDGRAGSAAVDGGSADSGGETPDSSMTGSGGSGSVGSSQDACVDISGLGEEPWFDLTIAGAGFDADEGRRIRIVAGTEVGRRISIANAPIVDGGFMVELPKALSYGNYVSVVVYIDRNEDDACDSDEHVAGWQTGFADRDRLFGMRPGEQCNVTLDSCIPQVNMGSMTLCWVGADLDLTEPLPCDP